MSTSQPIKSFIATALTGAPMRAVIEPHNIAVGFSHGSVRCNLCVLSKEAINELIEHVTQCDTVRSVSITTIDGEVMLGEASMISNEALLLAMSKLSTRTGLTDLALVLEQSADAMLRDHVVRTISNNQLERISLDVPPGDDAPLRDAIADHQALRNVEIRPGVLSSAAVIAIVERNRSIRDLKAWRSVFNNDETDRLLRALRNNWVMLAIHGLGMPLAGRADPILASHARSGEIHGAVAHITTMLLPLGLPVYVMLWIVDWLPPMSTRYAWAPDGVNVDYSYDPFHGKKIALIEGIALSYWRILDARR
jgi:hypothetical protein